MNLKLLIATFVSLLISVSCFAEEISLSQLNANYSRYIGTVVTVEGATNGPTFDPENGRVDFSFTQYSNVSALAKVGPIYDKIADMGLKYGDSIKVTGEVKRFSNSSSAYILIQDIEKGSAGFHDVMSSILVYVMYGIGGITVLGLIARAFSGGKTEETT